MRSNRVAAAAGHSFEYFMLFRVFVEKKTARRRASSDGGRGPRAHYHRLYILRKRVSVCIVYLPVCAD